MRARGGGGRVLDKPRNYYHIVQKCCGVAVFAYKLLISRLEEVCVWPASGFGHLKWGKGPLIPAEQEAWWPSGLFLMFWRSAKPVVTLDNMTTVPPGAQCVAHYLYRLIYIMYYIPSVNNNIFFPLMAGKLIVHH